MDGFGGAEFKKFSTRELAEYFLFGGAGPSSMSDARLGYPKWFWKVEVDPKGSAAANSGKASSSGGKAPSAAATSSARAAPYQKPKQAAGARSQEPLPEASLNPYEMAKRIASLRSEMADLKQQMARHVAGKAPASAGTSSSGKSPGSGQLVVDSTGFLNVWTDGACAHNGRRGARAGVGVWFSRGHPLNVSAPVEGPATNNNAEIQAAWVALELAAASGHSRVLIHTDSQFVINCATKWMHTWQKNGWTLSTGGPVKNRTQLEALARVMEGMQVKWVSSGPDGNKIC